jgi:hypothetical protein
MYPRLALNSRSSCLNLPSAEITDMYHHTQFMPVLQRRKLRLTEFELLRYSHSANQ